MKTNYQHWRLHTDEHDVLWLTLDRADSKVNSLNQAVLGEFDAILQTLAQKMPRALIIQSGKTSGFIAGADIEQFTQLKDATEATALIRQGQVIFDALASLPCPTIAVINGFCLGGGYELALACRYRIAAESPKTKIGLPEVMLGIHPGWGGTIRLPRLIGAANAMGVILTGRTYSAKAAAKLGMIDAAVPERHLIKAALSFALEPPKPHQACWYETLTNHDIVRPLLARYLRYKTAQKANPNHYPAPFAVIDNWQKEGVEDPEAFIVEAESIGRLMVDDRSRNLVKVFFLQDRLKGLAKGSNFAPEHVHVIGSGVMGGDIAAWCALRGMRVTLQDQTPERIAPAIKRAHALFQKKLKTPRAIQAAMDRLIPDLSGDGIRRADVIIEAIFENLTAKQQLFQQIERTAKPNALLATNTSCIPLHDIASVLSDPNRLVGIHFFNPVAKMPLVEVVTTRQQSEAVASAAIAFVRKIDKLPVPVFSSPGFLVNRVLTPYLLEAVYLYNEGVPLAAIDRAAKIFGMPMGPIELADTVGLDVCLAVAEHLAGKDASAIPTVLREKVAAGQLGRKTGQGFYEYVNGKARVPEIEQNYVPPTDLTDRLILRMINEAEACVQEGVIADRDLADAAMIFGTGFAPFRGGPLHYAETIGLNAFHDRLQVLAKQYGNRFGMSQVQT